jgi:hypothetical protein
VKKELGKNSQRPPYRGDQFPEPFFDACRGSSIPVSVLKMLMDRIVLKTFHAQAGASMDAWKRKNTAREVKGTADASLRADLKSKVSQTTKKKAGDFVIGNEVPKCCLRLIQWQRKRRGVEGDRGYVGGSQAMMI